MKKHYMGLDVLRGLGIFILVGLHSAFYYFGGLYDLDLENPPAIITVIGLLLMFAGMFALLSGVSHMVQFMGRVEKHTENIFKHFLVRGIMILTIAYTYFSFTGPGLVNFASRSMDNSFFVELIRNGVVKGISAERLLYVDSLVMIGSNIILLGLLTALFFKLIGSVRNKRFSQIYFASGLGVFALSLIRIPLYDVYLKAISENNVVLTVLLNWLVNKNNPILPYLAFGLMGMWIGTMLQTIPWKLLRRNVVAVGTVLFIVGVVLYIKLPDTMLKRGIDLKWYSIMMAQLGLFMLMIIGALKMYDFRKATPLKLDVLSKFISRFGVAGLTAFFLESIVSACVYKVIKVINPEVSLGIYGALLYGFTLAILWGIGLIFWERVGYKYGLEYFYGKIANRFGGSSKQEKLEKAGDKTSRVKKWA